MSFVHKDTGADVAVTARDEHEMRWMRLPEATYNTQNIKGSFKTLRPRIYPKGLQG